MRYYISLLSITLNLSLISTVFAQSVEVYDINPGRFTSSSPSFFTPFKGRLYFTAFDSLNGIELRSIDTGQSPTLVHDIAKGNSYGTIGVCPPKNSSNTHNCWITGGTPRRQMAVARDVDGNELALYFYGCDKPFEPGTSMRRYTLYKYDGINPPIAVITNFDKDHIAGELELTAIKDKVYFTVFVLSNAAREIYEYDHATNTYTKIFTSLNSLGVGNLTPYRSKLMFNRGDQYFEYDPDTKQQHQIATNLAFRGGIEMTVVDDILYYAESGGGLYAYDGTTVRRISPAICFEDIESHRPTNDDPYHYGESNNRNKLIGGYKGKVYFPCSISPKCRLCEYDPITNTTKQIPGVATPANFVVAKNKLFFSAFDTDHGYELWSYDGFSANRTLDIYTGKRSGAFYGFTSFKNELYLAGMALDTTGVELLKYVPRSSGSTNGIRNSSLKGKVELHPNPAENSCTISLELDEPQELKIHIYSNMGQEVETIPSVTYPSGNRDINLDISKLASGIYTILINDKNGGLVYNTRLIRR